MIKKLNSLLNIIIGTSVGVFIGHTVFKYLHYQKHPECYGIQSAPWYTSSVIYGAVTVLVLLIAIILKIYLIKKKEFE